MEILLNSSKLKTEQDAPVSYKNREEMPWKATLTKGLASVELPFRKEIGNKLEKLFCKAREEEEEEMEIRWKLRRTLQC